MWSRRDVRSRRRSASSPGVLIVVENLPVPFDRRVWQEARTLAAHGYEVSVICPVGRGYEARHEVIDGIAIWRHPLPLEATGALAYGLEYGIALFWQLLLSARIYRRRGFRILHACNPPDTIFLVALVYKLLFGCKFVFDHHDLNPELFVAKFGRRGVLYRLLLTLEKLTFRCADVVISTNNSYKEIAFRRGGIDPSRVFVVRSGPAMEAWRAVSSDPSLSRGRRYLVGYVGVIGKQEGIDYLVRAIHHIVHTLSRTDIHFGIVGGGSYLSEARELASSLEVSDFISFTGRVPDRELLAMLSTADICINPDEVNALNDLSTMNKIVEYMALGKPIVQFDTREGRFSAQDAAAYAAPNDAIDLARKVVELLDDPSRRQAMGEFGRRRFESALAWHHQVPQLLQAYALALDNAAMEPAVAPAWKVVPVEGAYAEPAGSATAVAARSPTSP
jgi:glycosyltransferase involved in cell wall biosynthesis